MYYVLLHAMLIDGKIMLKLFIDTYFIHCYAISFLFLYRYFTLFMNILSRCYEGHDEGTPKAGILAPHFLNLRGSTVQAMSNMLSANIDSGLMHSIGKTCRFLGFWLLIFSKI